VSRWWCALQVSYKVLLGIVGGWFVAGLGESKKIICIIPFAHETIHCIIDSDSDSDSGCGCGCGCGCIGCLGI